MGLLEEVGQDVERAELVGTAAVVPHAATLSSSATLTCSTSAIGSCRKRLPIARNDVGIAGRQEPVGAFAAGSFSIALRGERLRHLPRRLVGREDERDVAAEDALQDRPDQRVVRAAEDDRVDARLLERSGGLADGLDGRLAERVVALDQRHELRARDRHDGDAGVERPDQRLVAAARHGRLGREQADAPVARRADGRVGLRLDDAEHRDRRAPAAGRAAPPRWPSCRPRRRA